MLLTPKSSPIGWSMVAVVFVASSSKALSFNESMTWLASSITFDGLLYMMPNSKKHWNLCHWILDWRLPALLLWNYRVHFCSCFWSAGHSLCKHSLLWCRRGNDFLHRLPWGSRGGMDGQLLGTYMLLSCQWLFYTREGGNSWWDDSRSLPNSQFCFWWVPL